MPPTAAAGTTLRDLRVAEVVKQDLDLGGAGDTVTFRVKLSVSFKYEGSSS
jgi:flavin-binding protein dodecin